LLEERHDLTFEIPTKSLCVQQLGDAMTAKERS